MTSAPGQIARIDWAAAAEALDAQGFAAVRGLLTGDDCAALRAMYGDDERFRSRIDMARFRFGAGEYKYFAAPLPPVVAALRERLYESLAPVANRWREALDRATPPFPPRLETFLERCHAEGQTRPTPLLLTYGAGDYNCLHQDIYGAVAFPLQVVIGLSRPGEDYHGGEFLLVEQRPRAQSRATALTIPQGDGVIFATRERPVAGTRGTYRTAIRHGVSTVTDGRRMTLGIIFHDAK